MRQGELTRCEHVPEFANGADSQRDMREKTKPVRYQLRHAAGIYWILDMWQSGKTPVRPIPLNECGAFLFRLLQEGASKEQMTSAFCEEYGLQEANAQEDVLAFCEQMRAAGIIL